MQVSAAGTGTALEMLERASMAATAQALDRRDMALEQYKQRRNQRMTSKRGVKSDWYVDLSGSLPKVGAGRAILISWL